MAMEGRTKITCACAGLSSRDVIEMMAMEGTPSEDENHMCTIKRTSVTLLIRRAYEWSGFSLHVRAGLMETDDGRINNDRWINYK